MDEQPQPAQMPQEIVKRKEAITLFQIAVVALAIVAVMTVAGAILLSIWGRGVPESMVALGGVALGALAGMVAPGKGSE